MAITQSIKTLNEMMREHGQGTDMPAKKAVWKMKGLDRRLGRYEGTPVQVNALLKSLKNNPLIRTERGWEASPETMEAERQRLTAPSIPAQQIQPIQPAPQVQPVLPAQVQPPAPVSPAKKEEPAPTEKPTAKSTLEQLGIPEVPTTEDVMAKITGSAGYGLEKEKLGNLETILGGQAEVEKQKLAVQAEQDKKTLENKLAASGLAFSGIRTQAVQDLTNSLAASTLGVDRELAGKLLQANTAFKGDILNMVETTIKDAAAGRKDAIAQLNQAGFAVLGNQIVPTLAARKAEETKAPSVIGTAETGYFQWDSKTETWKPTGIKGTGKGKYSDEDINTFAQDVLYGRLGLASIPAEIRTEVSQFVDNLKQTVRTRTDDEIRSMVRSQVISIEGDLPKANKVKYVTKQKILDDMEASQTLTKLDKERIRLIVNEWGVK